MDLAIRLRETEYDNISAGHVSPLDIKWVKGARKTDVTSKLFLIPAGSGRHAEGESTSWQSVNEISTGWGIFSKYRSIIWKASSCKLWCELASLHLQAPQTLV
jgi:hypothetical protein